MKKRGEARTAPTFVHIAFVWGGRSRGGCRKDRRRGSGGGRAAAGAVVVVGAGAGTSVVAGARLGDGSSRLRLLRGGDGLRSGGRRSGCRRFG